MKLFNSFKLLVISGQNKLNKRTNTLRTKIRVSRNFSVDRRNIEIIDTRRGASSPLRALHAALMNGQRRGPGAEFQLPASILTGRSGDYRRLGFLSASTDETLTRRRAEPRASTALCNPVSKFRRDVRSNNSVTRPTWWLLLIFSIYFCCAAPRASLLFKIYRFTWPPWPRKIRGGFPAARFAGTIAGDSGMFCRKAKFWRYYDFSDAYVLLFFGIPEKYWNIVDRWMRFKYADITIERLTLFVEYSRARFWIFV